MSPDLWVPGVLILAVGAAAGWWLTRRKAGSDASGAQSSGTSAAGSSLEIEDLRHRRDELYARLRASDLDEKERRSLELEAAKILQKLDGAESQQGSVEEVTVAEPRSAAAPHSKPRTLLTGFVFGGATVALIAVLVFWAGRDAAEKDPMSGQGGARGAGQPTAEQPHPVGILPVEVEAEVGQILEHLASEPGDIAARKRLALLYLNTDQYVPAFEQAEAVLAAVPDDIDSLYVQGVVRMTMGQDAAALDQLDRVLELFPNHVRAMTVKGLVFARQGNRDQAAAIWNRALEIGGPQPQIENLLAMFDAEANGELPPGHPPADSTAGPTQAGRITAPGEYRVRVEAETIPGFQQTGSLFVSLRTQPGGPPIAVKRINQPTFPLLVGLGQQDMMMAAGGELPKSGILTVRLDQDGNVSSRGEDDLEGSAEASRGDLVTIFLN